MVAPYWMWPWAGVCAPLQYIYKPETLTMNSVSALEKLTIVQLCRLEQLEVWNGETSEMNK